MIGAEDKLVNIKWTTIRKVIKLARSSLKKWAHLCAHKDYAVNILAEMLFLAAF